MDLPKIEMDALKMLLEEAGRPYPELYEQLSVARIKNKKYTGVGFQLNLEIPHDAKRIKGSPTFPLALVFAEIKELKRGAGFVLFIKDGMLTQLEGFTYDEPWPDMISEYRLEYQGSSDTGGELPILSKIH